MPRAVFRNYDSPESLGLSCELDYYIVELSFVLFCMSADNSNPFINLCLGSSKLFMCTIILKLEEHVHSDVQCLLHCTDPACMAGLCLSLQGARFYYRPFVCSVS